VYLAHAWQATARSLDSQVEQTRCAHVPRLRSRRLRPQEIAELLFSDPQRSPSIKPLPGPGCCLPSRPPVSTA